MLNATYESSLLLSSCCSHRSCACTIVLSTLALQHRNPVVLVCLNMRTIRKCNMLQRSIAHGHSCRSSNRADSYGLPNLERA